MQFSHYAYYDDVLDAALGDEWLWHERESWVWIKGRFVPYPFQNNIHRLDREDMELALRGLERAAADASDETGRQLRRLDPHDVRRRASPSSSSIPTTSRSGACRRSDMGVTWMGERVAVPDIERIRKNIAERHDDVSWGPNNRFRFPRRGGHGRDLAAA